ncbi:hypothetical protein PUN28_018879 [Cardiocondyla obscurior]|uniref:Uncharacterized protein n=1 Tax=Cardiocondyla obscurior TaxID=286306 RepID=A0AAW2EDA0_9HYME
MTANTFRDKILRCVQERIGYRDSVRIKGHGASKKLKNWPFQERCYARVSSFSSAFVRHRLARLGRKNAVARRQILRARARNYLTRNSRPKGGRLEFTI